MFFSIGLSVAFLMFIGLLANELYPLLGIIKPLSIAPLTITISLVTIVLFFAIYWPARDHLKCNLFISKSSNTILKQAIKFIILFLPALLGIFGSLYTNVPLLQLMIVAIIVLYVFYVFTAQRSSSDWLSLMIFLISFALAIQVLLTSKYIVGYDANLEYYVFNLTTSTGHWKLLPLNYTPLIALNYDSMLSITILPAIYSVFFNTSGEIVFKTLYPFIFSIIPVALFKIYQRQFGKTAALLSALFFISGQLVFFGFEPLSLNRQIIAEFFLVLSLFIIFNKDLFFGS
jgi:uncharacterized membrane protein